MTSISGIYNAVKNFSVEYGNTATFWAGMPTIDFTKILPSEHGYYLFSTWPWNSGPETPLVPDTPVTSTPTPLKDGFHSDIKVRMNRYSLGVVGDDMSPGLYTRYDKIKGPEIFSSFPCNPSRNYLYPAIIANSKPWYVLRNKHNLVQEGYQVNFPKSDLYKKLPTTENSGKGVEWPDQPGINVPEGWTDSKGDKFSVRKIIESSDIDKQCEKGNAPVKRGDICYICRFPLISWMTKGDNQGGAEGPMTTGFVCEHKIPVFLMALICGIYGPKSKDAKRYLFTKLPQLLEGYEEWQSIIWVRGYGWSHSVCNFIKNDLPYILFKLNILQTFDPDLKMEYSERNAQHLLKRLLKYNRTNEQIWRKWYTSFLGNQLNINFVDTTTPNLNTVNGLTGEDKEKLNWWVERTANEMFNEDISPLMEALNNNDDDRRSKYQACSFIIVGMTIVDNSKKYSNITDFPTNFSKTFNGACALLGLSHDEASLNDLLEMSGGVSLKRVEKILLKSGLGKGVAVNKSALKKKGKDRLLMEIDPEQKISNILKDLCRDSSEAETMQLISQTLNKEALRTDPILGEIVFNTIRYYIEENIIRYCKKGEWAKARKEIDICLYHLFNIMDNDELLLGFELDPGLQRSSQEHLDSELSAEKADIESKKQTVRVGWAHKNLNRESYRKNKPLRARQNRRDEDRQTNKDKRASLIKSRRFAEGDGGGATPRLQMSEENISEEYCKPCQKGGGAFEIEKMNAYIKEQVETFPNFFVDNIRKYTNISGGFSRFSNIANTVIKLRNFARGLQSGDAGEQESTQQESTQQEFPQQEYPQQDSEGLGGGKILINNKRISKKQQEKTIINYLKTNKASIKSLKDKNRKLKKTYRKKLINKSKRINKIKTKRINKIKTKRINKRNKIKK